MSCFNSLVQISHRFSGRPEKKSFLRRFFKPWPPYFFAIVCFVLATPAPAELQTTLTDEVWSRPRTANSIRQLPAINTMINAWMTSTQPATIELRYPGGEEGTLWALELRDWIITLGIPSTHILTTPGHPKPGEISIHLLRQ